MKEKINTYKTKQRDLILALLINNKNSHLTAEDVFEKLRSGGNSVGKSTVYRYLDRLVEEGKVRKFVVDDISSACFQYIDEQDECHEHYHLKCSDCGMLFHVECEYLDDLNKHIFSHHKFKIDNLKTVLYGLCENCASHHNSHS